MEGDAANHVSLFGWLFLASLGLSVGIIVVEAILYLWGKMGIAFPATGFFNRPPTITNPSLTRVIAVGNRISSSNLPPGWSYNIQTDSYEHSCGLRIDSMAIAMSPRGVYQALLYAQTQHLGHVGFSAAHAAQAQHNAAILASQAQHQTTPATIRAQQAIAAAQHQALTQQFNQNRLAAFPGGLTYFSVQGTSTSAISIQSYTTTGVNPMWFSGNGGSFNSFDDPPTTDTSELLRASEIVEQFESFMKSMGVKSPLKLPGEVFTRWLAYEAGVREDGDAISPTTREILIGLENHPAVVEQIKAGE